MAENVLRRRPIKCIAFRGEQRARKPVIFFRGVGGPFDPNFSASQKALINITSDGLLNLTRVAAPVGYEMDRPIGPHPIFPLIQRHAGVDDSEMYEVFNMGIGFCYVVEEASAERTLAILKAHGRVAQVIGTAVSDPQKNRAHSRPRACGTAQAILAKDSAANYLGLSGRAPRFPTTKRL